MISTYGRRCLLKLCLSNSKRFLAEIVHSPDFANVSFSKSAPWSVCPWGWENRGSSVGYVPWYQPHFARLEVHMSAENHMTPSQERRFKSLEALRKASWISFSERRSVEWKVSLALWTALAVFTGALLTRSPTESYQLNGFWPVLVTALVGLAIVVVHTIWLIGINQNHQIDRELSHLFRKEMCELVRVPPSAIEPILDKYSRWPTTRRPKGKRLNYSHLSEITLTTILALGAVCAMYARTHAQDSPKGESTTPTVRRLN